MFILRGYCSTNERVCRLSQLGRGDNYYYISDNKTVNLLRLIQLLYDCRLHWLGRGILQFKVPNGNA